MAFSQVFNHTHAVDTKVTPVSNDNQPTRLLTDPIVRQAECIHSELARETIMYQKRNRARETV